MGMKSDFMLMGRIVVITGASSGFGRGAALAFAREGAHLVLAARRGEVLREVVRECEAAGVNAIAVPTDVSDPAQVARLSEAARDAFTRVDVWVNGAGQAALGSFTGIAIPDHEQVIATDLLGTLYGSHHAVRLFIGQGYGTLINIASETGKSGSPYYSSYSAARHGVLGLSASIRQELELCPELSIHVCTILPGSHDATFADSIARQGGQLGQSPTPLHDPDSLVGAIVEVARKPVAERVVGSGGSFMEAFRFASQRMFGAPKSPADQSRHDG